MRQNEPVTEHRPSRLDDAPQQPAEGVPSPDRIEVTGVATRADEGSSERSGVAVELDPVAVALARAAAVEEAGSEDAVGPVLDAVADDDVAVTARFASTDRGYRGWAWSVTLGVLEAAHPTVSEVVLLPGPEALLAPPWIPWDQRIRSGDLGVGDLLPSAPDDPRLAPGYLQSTDPAVEEVALEVGLGRMRVMSRDGLMDTAERWHDGPYGPDDDMATHAPAHCLTCAFFLPLQGSLGVLFGACGNEFSPADGRVVDAGYGCGAHSEALTGVSLAPIVGETVVDELRLEVHDHPTRRGGDDVDDVDDVGDVDDVDDADDIGDVDDVAGDGDADDDPPDELPDEPEDLLPDDLRDELIVDEWSGEPAALTTDSSDELSGEPATADDPAEHDADGR